MTLKNTIFNYNEVYNKQSFKCSYIQIDSDLYDLVVMNGDVEIEDGDTHTDDDGYRYYEYYKIITYTKQFVEGLYKIEIYYDTVSNTDRSEAEYDAEHSDDVDFIQFTRIGSGQLPGDITKPFSFREQAC